MKLLIGNTGLVGSTLKENIHFDFEFNSKNLKELLNIESHNHDLYLCCLPATKWMINKDPVKDFNNMVDILNILTSKQYNNIILYSTIDIYQNELNKSNENDIPPIPELNYGSIRLLFEHFVKDRLKYNKLKIIRLPALYGKRIKKNILYDLLNDNNISNIPWNSKFQWYNVDKLFIDTEKILNSNKSDKVQIINLFTEPIETSIITSLFGLSKEDVNTLSEGAHYNCQTIYYNSGFIETKDEVLHQIQEFIKTYKK
jgi:hypothetical protein